MIIINNIYSNSLCINTVGINTNPGDKNKAYGSQSDPGIPSIVPYNRTQFLQNNIIVVPEYLFSSKINYSDLNPTLPKNLTDLLTNHNINNNNIDFNINIQANRWQGEKLLFRPHSYIDPDLPLSKPGFDKKTTIKYTLAESLDKLGNLKQDVVYNHQGKLTEIEQGIVYSPNNMPIAELVKLEKDKTNIFYSVCIVAGQKACVTLHLLLSEQDRQKFITAVIQFNQNYSPYVSKDIVAKYMYYICSNVSLLQDSNLQAKMFEFLPVEFIPDMKDQSSNIFCSEMYGLIGDYNNQITPFHNSNLIQEINTSSLALEQSENFLIMPKEIAIALDNIREQSNIFPANINVDDLLEVIKWCKKSFEYGCLEQEKLLEELSTNLQLRLVYLDDISEKDSKCFSELDNARLALNNLKQNLIFDEIDSIVVNKLNLN